MIFSQNQNSPIIQDGYYNSDTNAIEIGVRYAGGCAKHEFQLQIDSCFESYPLQCTAQLIDLTTDDYCEAIIYRTISIDLHAAELDTDRYAGAIIKIQGADDSKVLITLPM